MITNEETIIASGLIRRNFLEDFPQHIMTEVGNEYQLIISSTELSLVFELNPIISSTDLSQITPQCVVKIPFKVYDDSNITIDWGDRNNIKL